MEWQGERCEGNGKCTTCPKLQNKNVYKIWNNLFQHYHLSTPLPVCLFVFCCFFLQTHPHFILALLNDPCVHLVLHHYTHYLPHLSYLLLSATLLNLAATKQPFYKSPLHHSTLTFYYAILPNFYYACL